MRGTRLAFLAFTLTGPGVLAHHSSVVHYDQDAELTHENVTILDWRFSNPHARLVFVAPDQRSGEPVEWTAQSTNVNRLARFGYSIDTFQPGEVITVVGNPSRDGRPDIDTRRIVRSDGRVVNFDERAEDAPPPAAIVAAEYESDRDFSGVWENIYGPVPPEVVAALVPEDAFFWETSVQAPERVRGESRGLPLTEAGQAFLDAWTPDYDECRPTSGWMGQSAPFLHEIEKPHGGRVHVRTEYQDQERTLWLDGRPHPSLERVPRSLQGFSSGHWEGNALVAKTVHMLPSQITRNGVYHSENAVMTERIYREGDTVTWLRVIEDPDYFTQPVASVVRYQRTAYPEVPSYGHCTLQQTDAE